MDQSKKTMRHFYCRDVLWETFEQMARELECSVDYLINEAMKQYARQRSQDSGRAPYPAPGREPSQPGAGASAAPAASRAPAGGALAAQPPNRVPSPPNRAPLPPPPPPPSRGPTATAMPAVTRSTQPPGTRTVPPPLPRTPMPPPGPRTNGFPGASAQATILTLVYQGERFPINKDRFVIGRGKQSSDLTLKDPNVSRQHAMVEFQNGVYFMVDMGSTNGVEYNGQRIARKQIAEGDVFRICDHGLAFTYR